ncbi:MAG: class I SAM-dependent methyltransferase [Acidipropionibacterium sp.]|nr:class I SAM-dependent methyltransferase [Acidipropionibacterium sp.]
MPDRTTPVIPEPTISEESRRARAGSFGEAAAGYQRYRPDYPLEAVSFLIDGAAAGSRILDLGAGTGKLTDRLLELGFRVVAVDPSAQMLAELSGRHPGVECRLGTGEAIPLPDGGVDGVVCGQAWHWMDAVATGRELARVLGGCGSLGLTWNTDHTDSGWLARIEQIRGVPRGSELNRGADRTPAGPGEGWSAFARRDVDWTRTLSKDDFLALWQTHSQWLTATPAERTEWMSGWRDVLATDPAVATLDEVEIPMTTECWVTRLRG